jgi:predicted nucleotidyltransferase
MRSYARGDERPDSDIDLLVVCSDTSRDPFEPPNEIRKHFDERMPH